MNSLQLKLDTFKFGVLAPQFHPTALDTFTESVLAHMLVINSALLIVYILNSQSSDSHSQSQIL